MGSDTRFVLFAVVYGTLLLAAAAGAALAHPVGRDRLDCADPYQTSSTDPTFTRPAPTDRLVLGRAWLPKASVNFGWPRKPNAVGNERFLKHGIIVTAGSPVTLTIPPSADSLYAFRFDSRYAANTVAASRKVLVIHPCPPRQSLSGATAWPGGYLVTHRACAPLVVTADGRSTKIWLALGLRCRSRVSARATRLRAAATLATCASCRRPCRRSERSPLPDQARTPANPRRGSSRAP